jgi:hypothetical protein
MYCKYCRNVNCVSVLEDADKRKGLDSPLIIGCDICSEEHQNTLPVVMNLRFACRMHCIEKGDEFYMHASCCGLYPFFQDSGSLYTTIK